MSKRRETGRTGYQAKLKKELTKRYPGCTILRNDPNEIQGYPDMTILYGDKYAVLEVKGYEEAKVQPNQPYYVDKANRESFGSFIFPENEKEVLDRLDKHFKQK